MMKSHFKTDILLLLLHSTKNHLEKLRQRQVYKVEEKQHFDLKNPKKYNLECRCHVASSDGTSDTGASVFFSFFFRLNKSKRENQQPNQEKKKGVPTWNQTRLKCPPLGLTEQPSNQELDGSRQTCGLDYTLEWWRLNKGNKRREGTHQAENQFLGLSVTSGRDVDVNKNEGQGVKKKKKKGENSTREGIVAKSRDRQGS